MMPFQLPTADATPHLGETDSQDMSAWLRLANATGENDWRMRAVCRRSRDVRGWQSSVVRRRC